MDLNTIKTLIDENKIKTLTELNNHYLLMTMNAIMFNEDGHTVNQDARELRLFCAQTIQVRRILELFINYIFRICVILRPEKLLSV